jgi:hypothetical protein
MRVFKLSGSTFLGVLPTYLEGVGDGYNEDQPLVPLPCPPNPMHDPVLLYTSAAHPDKDVLIGPRADKHG